MTTPVTQARIQTATDAGIHNAAVAAESCRAVGLPFFAACAVLQKESRGLNVYGHDRGGVNTVDGQLPVTRDNFLAFLMKVMNGATSNGVGPLQITYAGALDHGHRDGGYFRQMFERGLMPWAPGHNMMFGFELLKRHYDTGGHSWRAAGRAYNGADAYGIDLEKKVIAWKRALGIK